VSALRLPDPQLAWAQVAAALVNTAPRATHPVEELRDVAALAHVVSGCPEPPPAALAPADVAAFRRLRPRLIAAFDAADLPALAAELDPLLARAGGGWRLAEDADGGWRVGPRPGTRTADWFAAGAARGLAELAAAYGVGRLHHCSADDCLRVLVDGSRNGARRYCSRTCASRVNVRRHRARG
jgi:predicted RNA-binding Zn ribbon-like protein